ncbi:MAG: DUF4199 domain-containing protein [Kordia sp.]|nr:MAG: DUF4199 domain-containing protein [Kordia sp.]
MENSIKPISIKSNAINYGLYLGGALSVYTILCYGINIELIVNFWIALLVIPIVVVSVGIISTAKSKSINQGFLSYRQAFSSYFITIAVALIIHTLINIIIFNYIDPDASIRIKEIIIDKTISFMEKFNTPAEAMSEAIEKINNQDTFSFAAQLRALAQSLATFSIIGLLVAALMKKNKEEI